MDNAPLPPANPLAPDAAAPAPPNRVERHLRALDRVIELGMEMMESVQKQALAAVAADPVGHTSADLGVKFTRIARLVGQTVALSAKVANDEKAASNPRPDIDRRRRAAVRAEEYRRKDKVRAAVEQAVRAHAPPGNVYNLLIELDDRLDDPALEPELDVGRLGALVERLCGEFGVPADFDDWSDEECGFEIPHPSTVNIPPGVDPSGWFDRPPGQTLTEIILEAAAQKAEAEAKAASRAEPDPEKADPSPD